MGFEGFGGIPLPTFYPRRKGSGDVKGRGKMKKMRLYAGRLG